ncbi:MAG: nucleoside recognition domain-containing protein [Chthoniobacterales bacterium]
MALSRFWVGLFLASIAYLFFLLFSGRFYALEFAVNGKKDEPLLQRELYVEQASPELRSSLESSSDHTVTMGGVQYKLENGVVKVFSGKQAADGILPTCKSTVLDLLLPLIAYLSFFSGILQLLIDSGASERLAKLLSPIFVRVFPEVPRGHPSISYMTLNFAANFLGLDSAATPFGLKAMESLQELNQDKDRASNPQIMFLCLHAAGLTLIPTSIISYRAAQHAVNPADVMLPCIITSFIGTVAALVVVGIRQRINLFNATIVVAIGGIVGIITALLIYITRLDVLSKSHFTGNLSNGVLLSLILVILGYSLWREKEFAAKGTTLFNSFVEGAYNGLTVGRIIFPYILGMLVAISLFRNSGLFDMFASALAWIFRAFHVNEQIVNALPIAILRPFSSAGSRGFLLDAMGTYGADSFTGRLACVFQCAAETTFYVIAVYFGSVKIKHTRYALSSMLLVDLICVCAAIFVCLAFFQLSAAAPIPR